MSTQVKQELPKWFKGVVYDEGAEVRNPYSGESIYLNNIELSMYDLTMGASTVYEMLNGNCKPQIVKDLRRGLDWFRKYNAKAYMILLD
tara:strand:+ start:127 stop:393 length:267 start_codon:yes stop_codon:yes gene_type:complete